MYDLIPTRTTATTEEKFFEEVVVRVTRTTKVVSGGKRMSFTALAVVGNRSGLVGWGYGKAGEVPFAVEKAIRNAKRNVIAVPLADGHTLPHSVRSKFKATTVVVRPASKGTGIKAGAAVRAILEFAGIKNALTKVYGSTSSLNSVKAAFTALRMLRNKEQIEALRGIRVTGSKAVPVGEPKENGKKRAAPESKDKESSQTSSEAGGSQEGKE
jgi:small subunit ribosomal protein S5